MLIIGVASIYGTIFPAVTPFDFNIYRTVPFVLLLFLFALNTAYCTIFRLLKRYKARLNNISSGKELKTIDRESALSLLERLKKQKFNIKHTEMGIYITKGEKRQLVVLLVHFSIVMLFISAGLSSLTGFLGTANVHVNDKLSQCFDWDKKRDVELPFEIIVDSAKILYYPMPIKVMVESYKNQKRELITTKEGERFSFLNNSFKVLEADPLTGKLKIYLLLKDREEGPYENIVPLSGDSIKFTLKAYIDPIPKQYVADIAIFENKRQMVTKRVSINDPLIYKGYNIYLMNIAKDAYNFDYVGFQITKEPFMPLIWLSCILLITSLFLYPFLTEKRFGIVLKEDVAIIYSLASSKESERFLLQLLLRES